MGQKEKIPYYVAGGLAVFGIVCAIIGAASTDKGWFKYDECDGCETGNMKSCVSLLGQEDCVDNKEINEDVDKTGKAALSLCITAIVMLCGCVIISVLRILHVGSSAFAALAGCMAGAAGFFMIGAFAVFFGFTRHAYEDDNEWPFEPEVDYASVLVCIGGFFACLSGGVYAYKYKN